MPTPSRGPLEALTPDEARAIADEDPELVYLRVPGPGATYLSEEDRRRARRAASYRTNKRRYREDPAYRRKLLDYQRERRRARA